MKIWIICIVFISGFLQVHSQTGFRQVKDISVFKTQLDKISATTNTIESEFVQEKELSVLSEKIKSYGKFYFKKDNLLRWEYLSPFKYLILINHDKVTIKDDNKTNRFDTKSNQMFKKITEIMTSSLNGSIVYSKDFSVTSFENDKMWLLKLIPTNKTMKDFFSNISIYLDKKDITVNKLEMYESGGDFTIINFTKKKINQQITDEKFIVK